MKLLVSILLVGSFLVSAEWDVEIVNPGTWWLSLDLEVGSDGLPQMTYGQWDWVSNRWYLFYSFNNGTYWETECIYEPAVIGSIAIDAMDHPHIAFLNGYGLHYIYWDGTEWHHDLLEEMETDIHYESECSGMDSHYMNTIRANYGNTPISLDSFGRPNIAYHYSPNDELRYIYWDGFEWNIEIVDSEGNVGCWNSLALNSANQPYISYSDYDNKSIKFARRISTGWEIFAVDSGYCNALAIDSDDIAHIAYCNHLAQPDANLKYAVGTGTAWQITTVDSVGETGLECSICLNQDDEPSISYQSYSNMQLLFASLSDSNWTTEYVSEFGGRFTSLQFDVSGIPHIAFATSDGIMYASRNETSISTSPNLLRNLSLDIPSPNPFSSTTSIDFRLSTEGSTCIEVYDLSGRLVETLVDGSMEVGEHSVVFDGSDLPDGVYMIRLKAETAICTERCVLIR